MLKEMKCEQCGTRVDVVPPKMELLLEKSGECVQLVKDLATGNVVVQPAPYARVVHRCDSRSGGRGKRSKGNKDGA